MSFAITELDVESEYRFRLKATHPGTYRVRPATIWPMYDPGRQAYAEPFVLKVER